MRQFLIHTVFHSACDALVLNEIIQPSFILKLGMPITYAHWDIGKALFGLLTLVSGLNYSDKKGICKYCSPKSDGLL